MHHRVRDLLLRDLLIRPFHHKSCLLARQFQHVSIAQQIGHSKIRHPGLLRPEKLSRPTQPQVQLGNLETVLRTHHRVQPFLRFWRNLPTRHQHAIRLRRPAPNPSAQLMQLRQPKPLRVLHYHDRRVGNIHANLNHRG